MFGTNANAVLDVPVYGMTTTCRESMETFAASAGLGDNGYLEVWVAVEHVADGDSQGFAVVAAGSRIGFLGHGFPGSAKYPVGGAFEAPMQIFARQAQRGMKYAAYVWCGAGVARWRYSETARPALTNQEQRTARLNQAIVRLERFARDSPDLLVEFHQGRGPANVAPSLNTLIYELSSVDAPAAVYLSQIALEGLASRDDLACVRVEACRHGSAGAVGA
jgi:hypothetical protein